MPGNDWSLAARPKKRQARAPKIVGYLQSGRPIVRNPDGSVSTHLNMVVTMDDQAFLIPTIYGGKRVSEDEAIAIVRQNRGIDPDTGQPVPRFATEEEALAFEKEEHTMLEREIAPYRWKRR